MSVSLAGVDRRRVIAAGDLEISSIAYMIIFGSAANNLVDGMSLGAAFSDSLMQGLSIGIAVVSQQFPQELGTIVGGGGKLKTAVRHRL